MASRREQQERDEGRLRTAARNGDKVNLSTLLGAKVNSNAVGAGRKTSLHLAAENGRLECIDMLLHARTNVNKKDGRGMSPLHWAALKNHQKCAIRLIEGGAKVDAVDKNMQTPLHCAARSGSDTCVTSLLLRTADANARDKAGSTPLHVAAAGNHVGCVYELLDRRADVNALDTNGWSPLHHAVSSGKIECLAALVGGGANIGADNAAGKTALQLAQELKHTAVLAELESLQAQQQRPSTQLDLRQLGGADNVPKSALLATAVAGMSIMDSPPRPSPPTSTLPATPPPPTPPRAAPGYDGDFDEVQAQDLQMYEQQGSGSFGTVYKADWHHTTVAVKVLKVAANAASVGRALATGWTRDPLAQHSSSMLTLSQAAEVELYREAGLMSRMRHPHLVLFMGVCKAPLALVTEFCERGSLYDVLSEAKTDPAMAAELTWPRRVAMARDVAKGMLYLHTRQPVIIHRDLKSPNILVTRGWDVKVTDFGLSRLLNEQSSTSINATVQAINPRWAAPEIICGQGCATKASDVYSFGMVLYELLTWKLPWDEVKNPYLVAAALASGQRPDVSPAGGTAVLEGVESFMALMERCWGQQPHTRPQFDEITQELGVLLERVAIA